MHCEQKMWPQGSSAGSVISSRQLLQSFTPFLKHVTKGKHNSGLILHWGKEFSGPAFAMSIDTGWSFLTSLTGAQRIRATSASLIRGWLHWGSSHLRDVACHAKSGWVRGMGCIHNLTRPVSSYINYTTFSSRVVSVNSQAQRCMGKVLLQGLLRLSITCPGTTSLQEESFGLRSLIPID